MADQTGVIPSGTLTRHPADWFSDNLYTAGYSVPAFPVGAFINFTAVGLYNQDVQGRVCKIYGMSIEDDGGESTQMYFVHGTIGALVGPALSIRPDYPSPNVYVYQETITVAEGTDTPFTFPPQYGLIGSSGYDGGTYLSPFPLFIIPVGWSLVGANRGGSDLVGVWFWFQLANK